MVREKTLAPLIDWPPAVLLLGSCTSRPQPRSGTDTWTTRRIAEGCPARQKFSARILPAYARRSPKADPELRRNLSAAIIFPLFSQ